MERAHLVWLECAHDRMQHTPVVEDDEIALVPEGRQQVKSAVWIQH